MSGYGSNVYISGGTVRLGESSNAKFFNSNLTFNGGKIDLRNNKFDTVSLKSFIGSGGEAVFDINLETGENDRINATSTNTTNSWININSLNIVADSNAATKTVTLSDRIKLNLGADYAYTNSSKYQLSSPSIGQIKLTKYNDGKAIVYTLDDLKATNISPVTWEMQADTSYSGELRLTQSDITINGNNYAINGPTFMFAANQTMKFNDVGEYSMTEAAAGTDSAILFPDGKYYTVDGAETTLEGLDIKKFENLTISVTVYDKEGDDKQAVSAPTGTFNLYHEVARFTEEGVTIEDGKLSADALYPGKYIIMIDGYLPAYLTVDKDTTEYNLELYCNDRASKVSVNDETGDITMNNPWNGGVLTTLKDDITGENYMTEFTLKYQFEEGKNWGWTERFSIILGMSPVDEKPIGFMFFMAGDDEIKGANCVSNDIRWFGDGHEGFQPFAKGSADVAAINTAIKGEGLKVRGVRNGDTLTVYFLIGTEWKQAWTKTVEGLSSYIGVTAAHSNSTLTVTGIAFGEYVAATDTVAAHLVVGEGVDAKVYTLDGVETTLEDLAITQE